MVPRFTGAAQEKSRPKTEPIQPLFRLLTNFATNPGLLPIPGNARVLQVTLCASTSHSGALLRHAGEGLAGLLDRTGRGLCNSAAVLNHVLQAFADQLALDRGKLL